MNDSEAIVAQARALGEAIAAHERTRAFLAAQEAVSRDEAARNLLNDHSRHVEHIHRLEEQGKPIEVADKHKLRDLQSAMASNAALKQLMKAQADYLELVNRVHQAMDAAMGPRA